MKKKKVRKAPAYLKRPQKENNNLAFFDSPYYKYVIAGTAVVLVILSLAGILYLQSKGASYVLGAHTIGR